MFSWIPWILGLGRAENPEPSCLWVTVQHWLVNTHLAGSWQQVQLDVGVRKAVVVHRLEPLEVKTGQLVSDPEPKDTL